ncbi:DUF4242 domain-containing protein [Nocardioides humilatus]|uniref:DUF4242 domain-containing protein n=1 Tax=Nocardioides humilatus TaxID=2607660 RepID=A0A5B1LPP6_9ACTN|nr:nickel-binding protein [Nocardioides humilatus]KAA1421629.1 DUF4242 domain-containing protein [Nocardioides humilatus]
MSRVLPDSPAVGPPYVRDIDTIRELQVFLVERYLPDATIGDVRNGVERIGAALPSDGSVRHVSSTLVPDEGAVFAVFEAVSAEAVLVLNRRAGLQVDRLVEGVHVTRALAQVEGAP